MLKERIDFYWGFEKISCKSILFLFCFFDDKEKGTSKSLLNSSDLPSYGSNSRKRYTLRLLSMCLEDGEVLEVVLPGRGTNELP